MHIRGWVLGAAALMAACGDDGPTTVQIPAVAGDYAVTFIATQVSAECEGFVETGSTPGVLPVVQSEAAVTLRLTEVTDFILNDPVGEIDVAGGFDYNGPITVGDGTSSVTATGVIDGFFDDGGVDLDFAFNALGCTVEGTIAGTRQ